MIGLIDQSRYQLGKNKFVQIPYKVNCVPRFSSGKFDFLSI
jgi:hypothetical protein